MKRHLTLFLPGLLTEESTEMGAQKTSLPEPFSALGQLLSRASCTTTLPSSVEQNIKIFFRGLNMHAPLPAGALGALHHNLSTLISGQWCRVDLIECVVDQQTAYVLGNEQLILNAAQEKSLIEQLNQHLQQDGMIISPVLRETAQPAAREWYCYVPSQHDVILNDLLEVMGKSLHNCLPSGPHQAYWHRLITECQMLLARSPLQINRLTPGATRVLSLWFWGLGPLPTEVHTLFDQVYSHDAIMGGLAKCAGITARGLPTHCEEFLKTAGKNTLVADLRFMQYGKHQDYSSSSQLLHAYEKNWFRPLIDALNEGTLQSLTINLADGREFKITKKQLKYFWRRIQPLAAFKSRVLQEARSR